MQNNNTTVKQFKTVKALVDKDLETKTVEEIETISEVNIDEYFQKLQRTKAHLCSRALKLSTVNRYVEKYLKTVTK